MHEQRESKLNLLPILRSAFGNSLGNISISLALLAFGIGITGQSLMDSIEMPNRPRKIYEPGDLSVLTDKVSYNVSASLTFIERLVLLVTGGFVLICLNTASFVTGCVGCFRTPRGSAIFGTFFSLFNLL